VLWGFGIWCIADGETGSVGKNFALAQSWVTQNFSWFYIGTQDIWCLMLVYVCFSRYGDIRLGKDNERARFGNFTWFALLFTCGVAVGLYYFGVAEPLYFYRQPQSWKGYLGAYDYDVKKVSVDNDAMRAQQAVFMAVYHWGVHGWVPYILTALVCGVVSFRWGMPMTIRSCFFPLIGNHAYGFIGDLIDALSIATTTFGVCTSLGLGVQQLAYGLQFLRDLQPACAPQALCESSGGTYDLNTYGTDSCLNRTMPAETCALSYLETGEDVRNAQYVIIWVLTGAATMSVLTGLNQGIVTNAKVAFSLGMIVLIVCLISDNTPYLLSLMVQTTGYYVQYVVQVGFDCEAFQQLNWEFAGNQVNLLWGSDPHNLLAKLTEAGVPPLASTVDCGDRPNPCGSGLISMALISQGAAHLIAKVCIHTIPIYLYLYTYAYLCICISIYVCLGVVSDPPFPLLFCRAWARPRLRPPPTSPTSSLTPRASPAPPSRLTSAPPAAPTPTCASLPPARATGRAASRRTAPRPNSPR